MAAVLCHGELARLRPPASRLTEFYLWVALGGALGGVFNAVVAPHVFTSVAEYPLAVAAVALEPVIDVKDVTRTYHVGDVDLQALQGVSLMIERGEFVAIVGSSGSGNSTLMAILGCLDRPTSGQYWFQGVLVMVAVGIYTQARTRSGGLTQATV